MKPIARWTIGNTNSSGYECLNLSIKSFKKLYDVDVVVCYNCPTETIKNIYVGDKIDLINQMDSAKFSKIKPIGVAWKLYPSRINSRNHEIVIDNDIIFKERIPEIDTFFENDCSLLLEGDSRTYGRFEKHVPTGYQINSGIYGMPPNFDFQKYIDFYCKEEDWEINALGQNKESATFDEQGLVALTLLSYKKFVIIPATSVTNCEKELIVSKGMHFIGLNRRTHHRSFQLYKNLETKFF